MFNKINLEKVFDERFCWISYQALIVFISYFYYFRNSGYSVDDSFITYRYALHLREGYGLVFNLGENYYGTTAAGYAILLAILTYLLQAIGSLIKITSLETIDVPQVSVIFSTFSLASITFLFPYLIYPQKSLIKWLCCIGASIVLFMAYPFNEVAGHETYAFIAALFGGSVLFFAANKPLAASILFAVAVTLRPDAILGIVALLIVDWRMSTQGLTKYLFEYKTRVIISSYCFLITAWLGFLIFHFGTPIPGTMAAKKVQVSLGYWPLYTISEVGSFVTGRLGFSGATFVGLGLLFLVIGFNCRNTKGFLFNKRVISIFATIGLFGLLSFFGYLLLKVTFWNWYGVPLVFSCLTIGAAGWVIALDWTQARSHSFQNKSKMVGIIVRVFPYVILILLSFDSLRNFRVWATTKNINQHIYAYTEVADFIKAESPDGAIIQMFEPGAFAYRLGPKYKVVDELGLITPGVAQALKMGDKTFLLDSYNPDYLVCSWKGSYSICDTDLMKSRFEYVGSFNKSFWQPYLNDGVRLFRAVVHSHLSGVATIETKLVIDRLSNIALGDRWGVVRKTEDNHTIFTHPGETTETKFDYKCNGLCENVMILARISELPKEAGPEAGNVAIEVSGRSGLPSKHIVVTKDESYPLNKIGLVADGELHFSVKNNGTPSFDWLLLTIFDKDTNLTTPGK